MCGICGTVGRADERELVAMTRLIAHRGPDGEGVRTFPGPVPAGLGHRRLAIIDPTPAGAQPMSFADRWWITYNGELYNFRELRRELESSGERFSTDCDTEVLLRMFVVHRERMLDRLNGIFAFAIWDAQEKRLFVARDRLGVKPLYYVCQGELFAFASELKALLPFLGRVELEPTALADFLTFQWVPDPKTAFKNVLKLPPGHYAWVDRDAVTVDEYWDVTFAPEERTEDVWRDEVRDAVDAAVRRQMVSDVPLGSFLSGGLDSSAIVAAMGAAEDRVSAWAIGYSAEDRQYEIAPDDLQYARDIARRFQLEYHEQILQPDVLELLPKTVWHLEELVSDPAAISTYLICREATREMRVMLSGMGGDEVFAGYPRYLAYQYLRVLDSMPKHLRGALERSIAPVARPGRPGRLRGPRRNLWKFMRAAGRSRLDGYLSFLSYYTSGELDELLMPGVVDRGYDPIALHRSYLNRVAGADELSRLLYLDAKTFLPAMNLTYTDKMAMAHSVEVRVPLLDDEVVALAARIPSSLKLRRWQRKYVLKRSQERVLPKHVIWRPKAGFSAPVRAWLSGDLAPLAQELLSRESIESRCLVDPEVVARLVANHDAGIEDNAFRLFGLLNLELWCRTFLDRSWKFDAGRIESREFAAVRST
jgi:asparagine synthase (glutamine-hydrolysing)